MSTLLLDRAHLEVRCEGDALAMYEAGQRRGTVPVHLLERCVIHGAGTRLDSGVLLRLAEAGVATVLFSPRVGRRVATVLGPAHDDAAALVAARLGEYGVEGHHWCVAGEPVALADDLTHLLWARMNLCAGPLAAAIEQPREAATLFEH
jgi:hypothetical protein